MKNETVSPKRASRRVSVVIVCLLLAAASARGNYPIFSQRFTADPSPIVVGDRVYVIASHDLDNQSGWDMRDFTLISSDDLVNWTDHGEVFDAPRDTAWASWAWAPALVARNGLYYLYYTNARDGTGVATASDILGPYTDPLGDRLVVTGNFSDPAAFIDDDGTAYLHVMDTLWGELRSDMVGLATTLTGFPNSGFPDYKEGGLIQKLAGFYNLSYSTTALTGYGPSYAQSVSDLPTRDFASRGKWFWLPADGGPNTHGDMFELAGRRYMVYHNANVAIERGQGQGFQRSIAIDRLYVDPDGTIRYFTSTRDWMMPVKYLDPFLRNEAETMAAEAGIETGPSSRGGRNLVSIQNGDWVKVASVDFGSGADRFTATVASATSGSVIEVRLDEVAGRLVATCDVPDTGGAQNWATASCPVNRASGVHDLYFVFTGGPGDLLTFDDWWFDGGLPTGRPPPLTVTKSVCLSSFGSPPSVNVVYRLLDNQDGTWSFQESVTNRYLALVDPAVGTLGTTTGLDPEARFVLVSNPDRTWSLRASNGKFLVGSAGAVLATFDESVSGSPRRLGNAGALFAIDDCFTRTVIDCDLNAVDVASSPTSPGLDVVFGSPCLGVDRTIRTGRVALRRDATAPGARFDRVTPGPGATLSYYQLGCRCDDTLRLIKDRSADRLVFE